MSSSERFSHVLCNLWLMYSVQLEHYATDLEGLMINFQGILKRLSVSLAIRTWFVAQKRLIEALNVAGILPPSHIYSSSIDYYEESVLLVLTKNLFAFFFDCKQLACWVRRLTRRTFSFFSLCGISSFFRPYFSSYSSSSALLLAHSPAAESSAAFPVANLASLRPAQFSGSVQTTRSEVHPDSSLT